jgi:hypothetical protein
MTDTEPTIKVTAKAVKAIVKRLKKHNLTEEQVHAVLDSWNALRVGDPVGTIRRDAATGAIAHRVDLDGVHLWRISNPDGSQHNDMAATLPDWEQIG